MCSTEPPETKLDDGYKLYQDAIEPLDTRKYLKHVFFHILLVLGCAGFICKMLYDDVFNFYSMDIPAQAVLLLILAFTGCYLICQCLIYLSSAHEIITSGKVDDDIKADFEDIRANWRHIIVCLILISVFIISTIEVAKAGSQDITVCSSVEDCRRVSGNFSVLVLVVIMVAFAYVLLTRNPE